MFRYQKLCGNGVKSSGKCVKMHEKSLIKERNFYHYIYKLKNIPLDTQHVEIGTKLAMITLIVWLMCENVWSSMWKRVKLYSWNSPAWVHTFRHPICWNWDKINKNTKLCDNCIKMCENIVKVCESSLM